MANYKEIYSDKPFIEELHRMDSLGDDGYEVWVYEGDPDYAPLSADYTYELLRNTNIVDGSEITVANGISMPIESLKIFGEAEYDRHGLPDEYIWLSYIKSTGPQYIDTGFKPNQDTRIVSDFYMVDYNTGYRVPFGTRKGGALQFFIGSARQNGRDDWYLRYEGQDIVAPTGAPSVKGFHHADLNKNYYTLDNYTHTFNYKNFQSNYNCYIFCVNESDTRSYSSAMELYNFKLYDNGTLIRDYIPCRRKSDNVLGLYDVVNNQFYTNAGTGTFVAGPEIGGATVTNPIPLLTKGTYNSTTKMWEIVVSDGINEVTLEHEQPLSSLGDSCVDKYDNGSLYYNTKYIGLTSGMNWKVEAAYTTDNILVVSAFLAEAIAEADYIYCTHFTPSSDLSQPNHITLKNRTLYLSIDKQDIASYDDFLRWVDNNNVVVIYQRKATRKISVLPSILLYSHDGTTVFSNDQNADMEIEYRIAPNAKMWQRQADGSFVEITE